MARDVERDQESEIEEFRTREEQAGVNTNHIVLQASRRFLNSIFSLGRVCICYSGFADLVLVRRACVLDAAFSSNYSCGLVFVVALHSLDPCSPVLDPWPERLAPLFLFRVESNPHLSVGDILGRCGHRARTKKELKASH